MATAQESPDICTDVVELCVLLQCLGYTVKSLDTSDDNIQDDGVRNVVLNCQSSGLHVVLESSSLKCSCPVNTHHSSGVWQVSSFSQGKPNNEQIGSAILGSLPKASKEKLSIVLNELMKHIKSHNQSSSGDKLEVNKSNSHAGISPEKRPDNVYLATKLASPARYRSLDTLTNARLLDEDVFPPPGALIKKQIAESVDKVIENSDGGTDSKQRGGMLRQSTYSVNTPLSEVVRNKTSSPIQPSSSMYDNLVEAKRQSDELSELLGTLLKEFRDEGKMNSSISSLALNVSNISLLKAPEKLEFVSSPNLTDHKQPKTHLKMFENAQQGFREPKLGSSSKISKLRRLSPSNFFKSKKEESNLKLPMVRCQSYSAGKLSGLVQPRIVTPVRIPKPGTTPEPSPRLNSSRNNKYSHIKSTIPKPSPSFRKKE